MGPRKARFPGLKHFQTLCVGIEYYSEQFKILIERIEREIEEDNVPFLNTVFCTFLNFGPDYHSLPGVPATSNKRHTHPGDPISQNIKQSSGRKSQSKNV